MARLTWQDVAAPNFSAAIEGMRASGEALNQGFNGIRATANTIDSSISDRVNATLQMKMLGAKNAQDVQAILSGADPNRINSESIRMAGDRPGQIIDLALKDLGLKRDTLNFDRSEDTYARRKAAEDDLRQLYALGRAGKAAEAEQFLSSNADIARLDIGDYLSAVGNSDKFGDERFTRTERDYNWNRTLTDHQTQDEADKLYSAARMSGKVNTVGDAIEWLRNTPVSNPRVYNILAERFGFPSLIDDTSGAGVGGGAMGGGMGGGANGGDPYNVRFGFDRFTPPPKALTDMTMGEVYDYGQNVLRPETRAAGFGKTADGKVVGTSAVGAYQFVSGTMETYAKRLYGDKWKTMKFTPEAQDAMAEALFNDSKGGNLKKVWEGLPDSRAGAYKNKTWPEMRALILQHESGGVGITTPAGQTAVKDAAVSRGRNQAASDASANSGLYNAYAEFAGNGKSVEEIAAIQRTNNSIFKGETQDVMATRLQQVIDRAADKGLPINAAQAAKILEFSLTSKSLGTKFGNWISGGLGLGDALSVGNVGDRAVDWDKLDANITDLAAGGAESRKGQEDAVKIAAGEEQVARQQLAQVTQQIATMRARRAHPSVLGPLIAQQVTLQGEINRLQNAQRGGEGLITSRDSGTRQDIPVAPARKKATPSNSVQTTPRRDPRATLPSQSYRPPMGKAKPLPKASREAARQVSKAQSLFDLYQ